MDTKAIFVGFTVPPSLEDIEGIAATIIDELPQALQKYTGKLAIDVEDFPDDFIAEEMEIETPFDLLGCYQSKGPAAIGRLARSARQQQDTLYLYRRPILDVWAETGEDLSRLINRVIITEIGTHFGFSAEDMDMYEEELFGGATVSSKSA